MTKIILRDYQREAVKFAVNVPKCGLCLKTGTGKTLITMFALRYMLKNNIINKVIIACTKTSIGVYEKEFKSALNIDLENISSVEEFSNFIKSDKLHVAAMKHSMFQSAGTDNTLLKDLRKYKKNNPNLNILLVVDEAHKISNPEGIQHKGYVNLGFLFPRIALATATPYSSTLLQLYGFIKLIHPEVYSSKFDFEREHIDYLEVRDKRGMIVKKEIKRYKNLKKLRELIEPFIYFYYPETNIEYIEEFAELPEDKMVEYLKLCEGLVEDDK